MGNEFLALRRYGMKSADGRNNDSMAKCVSASEIHNQFFANALLQCLDEMVVILDLKFTILAASQAFYQKFNINADTAAKKSIFDLRQLPLWDHPQLRPLLDDLVSLSHPFSNMEFPYNSPEDGYCTIFLSGKIMSIASQETSLIFLVFQDITNLKLIGEQLNRAKRLAILGQLAGGVGHELRNPLGSIKSTAYYLKLVLDNADPEVREMLDILDREVDACERIISSLLDFSNAKPRTRWKISIPQLIQDTISRSQVPETIKITCHNGEGLPSVPADREQLNHVFRNLIQNAIQSMPHGGNIDVIYKVTDSSWVSIAIKDSGEGIPQKNIPLIFEPLFTTKAKGVGLGLAVTKILVDGHGGSIQVESTPGKGACFTVSLPLVVEPEEPA